MPAQPALQIEKLGFPWQTVDPFLFCVHHDDAYPRGQRAAWARPRRSPGATSARTSPARTAGACTTATTVPGFPQHPHRGFETVTVVRRGLIDHSDSLGATARFGGGDVQWLTAGRGIVHAEMFPLLDAARAQPARAVPDLAQPAARADKMVEPHFSMLWTRAHPASRARATPQGRTTEVTVVAGRLGDAHARPPPPPRLVGRAARRRRGDLDAEDGARRAAGRCRRRRGGHAPHAVLLPGRQR